MQSFFQVLLKNYILNQIKSPYLEYDYIVKDNDTIEKILKKTGSSKLNVNFYSDFSQLRFVKTLSFKEKQE